MPFAGLRDLLVGFVMVFNLKARFVVYIRILSLSVITGIISNNESHGKKYGGVCITCILDPSVEALLCVACIFRLSSRTTSFMIFPACAALVLVLPLEATMLITLAVR